MDFFPKRIWEGTVGAGPGRDTLNHLCIALDRTDWDALVERLAQKGIPIEEGPVPRWGAHGIGMSIYFRDRENNLIEARYYDGQDDSERCLLES